MSWCAADLANRRRSWSGARSWSSRSRFGCDHRGDTARRASPDNTRAGHARALRPRRRLAVSSLPAYECESPVQMARMTRPDRRAAAHDPHSRRWQRPVQDRPASAASCSGPGRRSVRALSSCEDQAGALWPVCGWRRIFSQQLALAWRVAAEDNRCAGICKACRGLMHPPDQSRLYSRVLAKVISGQRSSVSCSLTRDGARYTVAPP